MDDNNRRALNFKADELEALVVSVERVKDILFGKLSPTVSTEKRKKVEWAKIADAIAAVSGIWRWIDSLKKIK
jgi:2-phospho-L-lactate guanylyltransferase (CobY/MobA/RfbA family)